METEQLQYERILLWKSVYNTSFLKEANTHTARLNADEALKAFDEKFINQKID